MRQFSAISPGIPARVGVMWQEAQAETFRGHPGGCADGCCDCADSLTRSLAPAAPSLIAVFLVNRSVKPFLLPLTLSFFGWPYVAAFNGLIILGSVLVGLAVSFLLDPPRQVITFPKLCRETITSP